MHSCCVKCGDPVTNGVEVEALAEVLKRTRWRKLNIWTDPEMLRSFGNALIMNEAETSLGALRVTACKKHLENERENSSLVSGEGISRLR